MLTRLAEESVNLLAWRIRPHRSEANSYLLRELRLGSRTETWRRMILLADLAQLQASAVGGGYLDLQWQLRCLAVPLGVVAASSPPGGGSAALDVVQSAVP